MFSKQMFRLIGMHWRERNAAIENFLTRGASWSSRGASFSVVGPWTTGHVSQRDHILVIDATESAVTYQLQVPAHAH